MQIFNQLGGIELANAYKLIKAISKKNVDVIAKFKPDFIKGAMSKGVSQEKAEEIFELILKFGGYGFNKSHSTRYAIVAFQTAYLKIYHPVEYMAALLTFEMGVDRQGRRIHRGMPAADAAGRAHGDQGPAAGHQRCRTRISRRSTCESRRRTREAKEKAEAARRASSASG